MLALGAALSLAQQGGDRVYQATGFKICEVDQSSAIIWTRLTRDRQRIGKEGPMPIVKYRNPQTGEAEERVRGKPDRMPIVEFPNGSSVNSIEGAVPGASGEVRVRYKTTGGAWVPSGWKAVDTDRDFTAHFKLDGLAPDTVYEIEVQSRRGGPPGVTRRGRFQTAPDPDKPARVVFTATTGTSYLDQDHPRGGFKMYGHMLALDPSFFVHTGDIVYYDRLGKTLPLVRWHWQRMYSLPTNIDFHRQVASYFIKDDHDFFMDDSWPGMDTKFMGEFTWQQGLEVFPEQVGMGEKTYRTIRWGKDLQVWLPEGRDYRSPNTMPDGPDKTIWGKEQMEWFERTVEASDAAFRVLISPTPVVGPDRENKKDNHSNANFQYEGDRVRKFLAEHNMVVVCGDRHWQYVSVDDRTGLREYSTGPGSDEHAGGFRQELRGPEHRYLNIVGGFLAGTVDREDGQPVLTFRHYSVDGEVLNEDHVSASLP